MTWNWSFILALTTIVAWIIPFSMLFIVPVNRKPSSATAWLLLLFVLPYMGLLIFLVSYAQRSYYEELLKAGVKIYWYPAPFCCTLNT